MSNSFFPNQLDSNPQNSPFREVSGLCPFWSRQFWQKGHNPEQHHKCTSKAQPFFPFGKSSRAFSFTPSKKEQPQNQGLNPSEIQAFSKIYWGTVSYSPGRKLPAPKNTIGYFWGKASAQADPRFPPADWPGERSFPKNRALGFPRPQSA